MTAENDEMLYSHWQNCVEPYVVRGRKCRGPAVPFIIGIQWREIRSSVAWESSLFGNSIGTKP